jgi:hypothetical protein
MSETANRTRKAYAIAQALATAGCDANTARVMDNKGWQAATKAAAKLHNARWTDASHATRTFVVEMLETLGQPSPANDDPFTGFLP